MTRTSTYVCTIQNNPEGLAKLATMRADMSAINKVAKVNGDTASTRFLVSERTTSMRITIATRFARILTK